ncbi:MAG: hypothetical protein H7A45_13965 [Verrucomicrobiales bacterium]|nr:hypothetical protein [Verrucomicrobiales bacterium]
MRPAALNSDEYCQSNEIEATPQCSPPTVIASRTTEVAGPSLLYWKLSADSGCYGRAQREIYVEDTGSSLAVGPLAIDTIVRIDRVPAGWPAFSYAFPPSYGFEIGLWVEGEAMIYAVDPAGQTKPPGCHYALVPSGLERALKRVQAAPALRCWFRAGRGAFCLPACGRDPSTAGRRRVWNGVLLVGASSGSSAPPGAGQPGRAEAACGGVDRRPGLSRSRT